MASATREVVTLHLDDRERIALRNLLVSEKWPKADSDEERALNNIFYALDDVKPGDEN